MDEMKLHERYFGDEFQMERLLSCQYIDKIVKLTLRFCQIARAEGSYFKRKMRL